MEQVIRAMEERRSVRQYRADLPNRADIDQIIEAGLYAASSGGRQATKIVCITNREVRDELSDLNRQIGGWEEGFDPFYGAPVVLVVLGQKDSANRVYDGSLVMGNLMLAAHALGYGSCWIHRAKEEFETEQGRALLDKLGIQGEWEGIGHCVIGYPDGPVPEPAKRKAGRVYHVE